MFPLRAQFFLSYGVYGGLLPFLPVFLEKERGLTQPQIGYVFGVSAIATILTPVLLTLLADTYITSRRLIGVLSFIGAAALTTMLLVSGFWAILACYTVWALAYLPVTALVDGYHFSVQAQRDLAKQPLTPYHHMRPLGTVGFLVPNFFLFAALQLGADASSTVIAAIIMSLLGAINTQLLPAISLPAAVEKTMEKKSLPTLAALRAMLEPHVLVFCISLWLVHLAVASYYTFYPRYVTEEIGIDRKWVGLVVSIGVTIEIGFILAWGWMLNRFGLKNVMIVGIACAGIRLTLLAWFPTEQVAVGTQVFHGMWVIVLHVAPPVFMNSHAAGAYRNSIQGLFVMLVYGTSRVLGNALGGHLSQGGTARLFGIGAGLCFVAMLLMFFAFHEKQKPAMRISSDSQD